MRASDIPAKFQLPFAASASGADIRAVPVTSSDPNAASQTLGFPPNCFNQLTAGGAAPDGRDFNGILNQSTAWDRWYSAGGVIFYDSTFQTAVGGYFATAVVASNRTPAITWISTVDNNMADPDPGGIGPGTGWQPYGPKTGDVQASLSTVGSYGWIPIVDGTIGNASSNATFASPTSAALFTTIYNGVVNTWAPLLDSSGTPVARGANAAADYAANRRLSVPLALGRALAVAGSGAGLSTWPLGEHFGEEGHALTAAENGPHTHGFNAVLSPGGSGVIASGGGAYANAASGGTTGSSGSGTAHNTIQPTLFLNLFIKL